MFKYVKIYDKVDFNLSQLSYLVKYKEKQFLPIYI